MGSSQTLNLAVKEHQAGNLREAERLYRQILQAEPHHVDALHLLGVIAHQNGRHEPAVELIRMALRGRPDFSEAHSNLGAALQALDKLDEAVACFRRALQLKPGNADAHHNLGNALRLQGKPAEAVASLQQALRLKPGYAEALTSLGLALQKLGRLDEAVVCHQQAVRHVPNHAPAHNNLGSVLYEQDRLSEAAASIQQALRLKPDMAEAHNTMGAILAKQGNLAEAVASYEQALRLKPGYAGAHNNLGIVLKSQGKLEEAIAKYQQALRLQPDFADAHNNLGVVFTELGRIDEAVAAAQNAVRYKPKHIEAVCQLARLQGGKLPDADRALLELRLADPELSDSNRVKLLFGLAEVHDAKGAYDRAAGLLLQANALMLALRRRNGHCHNVDDDASFVDNLMQVFSPAFFERVRGFGLETERPVFVTGLPRSGTTLTEQILAAHSQVFGAGELRLAEEDFLAVGTQPTKESIFANLSELNQDTVHRLARRHLDQLRILNGTATRVVDKMPENFFYLGLLAAPFPRAKFIHCRRDLRDVAVSCWVTNFEHLHWTNDREHILARFREYQRLMEHWRAVLPVPMLEVHYEETVADLPSVARRMVEWCGLDWDPACLAFHEVKRRVCTASVVHVRQPIFASSVSRWRNYERDLGELFAALPPLRKRQSARQPEPFAAHVFDSVLAHV